MLLSQNSGMLHLFYTDANDDRRCKAEENKIHSDQLHFTTLCFLLCGLKSLLLDIEITI